LKVNVKRIFQVVKWKTLIFYGVVIIFSVSGLYIGLQKILLDRLPPDKIEIPYFNEKKEIVIPLRPGIQGIIITGPIIDPLTFHIDLSKAGLRTLNWNYLQNIDPHTDVKINCRIDNKGRLIFSRDDLLMGGHTRAGLYIEQILKTWIYTPFKKGDIQFWFNLPSKGKKLIIDMEKLGRKNEIPAHIPIFNGQLHLIDGIQQKDIQEKVKF